MAVRTNPPINVDLDGGRRWGPIHQQFIYSRARNPIMYGGVGAGKTFALCRRVLRQCLKYPGNRGLLARYTLGESNDALLVTWKLVVPAPLYKIRQDRWGWVIMVFTEGAPSEILVRSLDEAQKYESLELGFVAVSQLNQQGITEDLWNTLDARVGRWKLPEATRAAPDRVPELTCFGEANSGAPWVIKLWGPDRKHDNPRYVAFPVSLYDNRENLAPDYVADMEAKPEWWKKWFLFPCWEPLSEQAGEPVFESAFNYTLHVSQTPVLPQPGWPIIRGWDIPGPIATVWFQIGQDGFLRVLFEQQAGHDVSVADVKMAVLANSNSLFPDFGFLDYGDPNAFTKSPTDEKSCADILRPEVILLPGEVTLTKRLEAIHFWLAKLVSGKPAVIFDPRCHILIGAFRGGYVWKQVAGRTLPEPVKNEYSHIMDALGHALARAIGISRLGRQDMMGPKDFGPPE